MTRPVPLGWRDSPEGAGLQLVAEAVPRGLAAGVLVLAIAGSLTEGLGLMLLVPVLGLVGAGGGAAGQPRLLAAWQHVAGPALSAEIGWLLALVVVLVALRAALVQARIHAEQALQLQVTDRLRRRLLGALFRADWLWLAQARQGQQLGVLLGAVDRLGVGLQYLQSLFAALITLAIMLVAALLIDPRPAVSLGIGGALVFALHVLLRRQARREGERANRGYTDYYAFYTERLANLRLVKSFGAERREEAGALEVGEVLRRARLGFGRGLGLGQFALQAGTAAVLGVTVWLAITRWHSSPVTLLPLIAISARAAPLLAVVQASLQFLTHDRPALADIGACHREAARHAELASTEASLPRPWRELRLDGVSLAYAGRTEPALAEVSLALAAGSTVHLAGPSGAGKSSLADLLAGLVSPTTGRVLVDGAELGPTHRRGWRERVAYVQQEPVLFHATIRENLLWAAPEASEAELRQALNDAAAGFVFALPQGLDTVVGARGTSLSGGERQRIALARGLLRRPELLILDEVTSALDAANEAAVAGAVAGIRGRMTVVIIGHRGALAGLADRRLTLAAGSVVGDVTDIASQFVAGGTGDAMEG